MAWLIGKVAASVGDVLGMGKENENPQFTSGTVQAMVPGGEMPLTMPDFTWKKPGIFQKKPPPEPEFKLETAPFDPRFPNTNQTRYCYQSYLDYHRCRKVKGEDYKPCEYFYKVYKSICPMAWIEKWDDQIASGTFAGKI